jgi:uncharacterized membrane protein YidH (DUF202 family)
MAMVAVILIVIGVIALAYGGLSFTTKEKVVELGPLKIEKDKTHSLALPPVLGILAIVGGIAVLAVMRR